MHATLTSAQEGTRDAELLRYLFHELNDSLGAVESLAFVAARQFRDRDRGQGYANQVTRLVEQTNGVIKAAAHSARLVKPRPRKLNLNEVLAEAVADLFSATGPSICIDFAPAAVTAFIDPEQASFLTRCLLQAFLRLTANAPVTIRTTATADTARITLTSEGDLNQRELVRLEAPYRCLNAARTIAQDCGGAFSIAHPCTFQLELPLASGAGPWPNAK